MGDKGETDYHELDKKLRNDFEPNQVDKFKIKDKDVGEYKYIKLKKTPGLLSWLRSHEDDWILERIMASPHGVTGSHQDILSQPIDTARKSLVDICVDLVENQAFTVR